MSPDRPYSPLLTDMGSLHTVMATTVALLDRILYGGARHDQGLARSLLPPHVRTVITRAHVVLERLDEAE